MDGEQKKEIHEIIKKEIFQLTKNIKRLTQDAQPIAPENAIGRVSRMDAINNKSVVEASLEKAKLRLKNLIEIKEIINTVDFGKCIRCKNPIPIQRIIIIPESRKCVTCSS